MSSLNFIGGEKGGVGKSVTARVLAQYFIDKQQAFSGFDTDRSHTTFARFYAGFASPVIVDSYEALDHIATAVAEPAEDGSQRAVIVDLAAQTAAPLARWIKDSDLITLLKEMGIAVNFWHLADSGKDSVTLLKRLIDTYGDGPNYFIVKNLGRGNDFSMLDQSGALQEALSLGARVISLPALHESSMVKIDRQDASFWAATQPNTYADALGMLERQRVKTWLKSIYTRLDELPL